MHPKEFGQACRIGLNFDIPTIGITKKASNVDGMKQAFYKNVCKDLKNHFGATINLVGESGKTWGAAFNITQGDVNPLFISQGHYISLPTAIQCVNYSMKQKQEWPEPIRHVNLFLQETIENQKGIESQISSLGSENGKFQVKYFEMGDVKDPQNKEFYA